MNRYKSRQKWRKVQAGYYKSPDERYWAQLIEGDWWLVQEPRWPRNTVGFRQRFGPFATLADCQEIVTRLEDPNDPMGAATESCGSCGADLGPSRTYPWHLDSEDCRAVREPVV